MAACGKVGEQDRGDALSLPVVGDLERELRRVRAHVGAVADDDIVGPVDRDQREAVGRDGAVRGTVEVDAGAEVAEPA